MVSALSATPGTNPLSWVTGKAIHAGYTVTCTECWVAAWIVGQVEMRLCSRNFLVRLCLELWLLFWLQPLFESQGEHFSFSSFLACVFHIKLIPSERKVMVEWYCHLKQSWLCYHQFLTWVGLHPNQKLLSPTNCDWMCTCVLLTGCVSWLRDFKAVGEGTVGGPDASQLGGVHNHVLKHLSAWKEDAAHKTAPCCDLGHHE